MKTCAHCRGWIEDQGAYCTHCGRFVGFKSPLISCGGLALLACLSLLLGTGGVIAYKNFGASEVDLPPVMEPLFRPEREE